ncbi:TetR/AcrR family transcriptional regulator [Lentzea flava]|uniref:TetR family transcriptional regulator n=1 Tax=Lentzea flava TaxID=103732 RepID=A0ABQ2UUX8_9PSEU|nr:TetR/AcrR family transcriptional regulator [Lentzea flava]MCP2200710.1 transcriptional regulator, TetR family [Lentzea flava]GGU55019.1 TetR family transcriptional regulator [Lentzea flava]
MVTASRPLRADAARNREKLLTAAAHLFAERGLDVPLEHIARRAEVSIGTLYKHFPTRDDFVAAIFPERLAALDDIGAKALADPDPWHAFAGYLDDLYALQAEDRGLNDVLARDLPNAPEVVSACHRGAGHAEVLITRAVEAGVLRPDYTIADLATLTRAMAQVIRDSPDGWQRFLSIYVEGLRTQ